MTRVRRENGRAPTERAQAAPLRLGFSRGIAPSKWGERWREAGWSPPLELVPLDLHFGGGSPSDIDVSLERAAPGESPKTASRHAVKLYDEAVALVVAVGHELASASAIAPDDLALLDLVWVEGAPESWRYRNCAVTKSASQEVGSAQEPSRDDWELLAVSGALDLVATGTFATLLPLPLAKHVARKRDHVVVPLGDVGALDGALEAQGFAGTSVWATWDVARDGEDVQRLIGVLRGRTPRSSR